ncbi:MAG: hypothetical protein K6T16_01310 [Candidatus Pacearchaeota archaeon]|nr:hypothetical protein [Candidatus Pacearchaeota archaeon]
MAYTNLKKSFHNFVTKYILEPIYKAKGDLKIEGKENLEEASQHARVVIATTHTNIERSIPIGLVLKEQAHIIIKEDMDRWYLNKLWLEPFIRLLNGKFIEGNESMFSKKDLETMAEVIDCHDAYKKQHEPKYVLIAVSGNFNTDNPTEFVPKRGLAVAYRIRLKENLKKGIDYFDSAIVPSVEFMLKGKGNKKKYLIVYGRPINPNNFITGTKNKIDFDTDSLTTLLKYKIRNIMASH